MCERERERGEVGERVRERGGKEVERRREEEGEERVMGKGGKVRERDH